MRATTGGTGKRRRVRPSRAQRAIDRYEANPNPPMHRPGLRSVVRPVQGGLEALGMGGAAHPIRRIHNPGGRMEFPWGKWVGPSRSITPEGQKLIGLFLKHGGGKINDVRSQLLYPRQSFKDAGKHDFLFGSGDKAITKRMREQIDKPGKGDEEFVRWMVENFFPEAGGHLKPARDLPRPRVPKDYPRPNMHIHETPPKMPGFMLPPIRGRRGLLSDGINENLARESIWTALMRDNPNTHFGTPFERRLGGPNYDEHYPAGQWLRHYPDPEEINLLIRHSRSPRVMNPLWQYLRGRRSARN